ncbi:cytochrome b5 reductase 4-like [Amphiura filiformis]|uniref:cytochrome b5 reductase 4-like n=1 Tax=Amphiura filiformis TaxID=82378 RepID=UPI003B219001
MGGLQVPQRGAGVQVPQTNTGIQVPTMGGLQVPAAGSGFKVPSSGRGKNAGGLQIPQAQFPALNSPQRASSQLLKPRQKVALKPGRSLMDWVRLGNAKGKVLNGIGGRSCEVSVEELAKHNKLDDAWMSIRGKVYNITPYMEYHPGGEEELMKGVGIDGTQLFNEVHQWVNVEGMLEKCYIGRLKKTIDLSGGMKKLSVPATGPLNLAPPEPKAVVKPKARYDWYQTETEVTITIYAKCNTITKDRVVLDKHEKDLRATIYIDEYVYTIHLDLCEDISDNYQVRVRQGPINRIMIILQKTEPKKWASLGQPADGNNSTVLTKEREPIFRSCQLICCSPVSHDTNLYTFQQPNGTCMNIPIGYHVNLMMKCNGVDTNRPYTAVVPSLQHADVPNPAPGLEGRLLHLMVKLYPDGLLTQQMATLKQGDSVAISDFEGNFDESRLTKCSHLIMLAAGTGFTPMIRLLRWCLHEHQESTCKLKLLFFNKTEKDILWHDQLQTLSTENSERFEVVHILSAADTSWHGATGRVRSELVEKYIPAPKDLADKSPLVCICGSTPFTNEAYRLIQAHGFTSSVIHLFTA